LTTSRSLVLGFHGCDLSTAIKVVNKDDDLKPSSNKWDWLGNGLYFWEDSYSRALAWSQETAKDPNGKIKKPAVLGAVIDLGNCLNLIDAEHLERVKNAYRGYMISCDMSGLTPAQNKGVNLRARYLDCAVIETLHTLRLEQGKPSFDSVRAFFVEGEPLYETSGLRALDHIQICVRNPRNILGYFLPRETGLSKSRKVFAN
jgi:hypothetical protein